MIDLIIVNYYSEEEILQTIESLGFGCKDICIYVVDNSKTLDLKAEYPNVIVLRPNKNLGYSGGNNLAFNYIKSNSVNKYLAVFNPDISVTYHQVMAMKDMLYSDSNIAQVYLPAKNQNKEILYDTIKLNGYMQTWNIFNIETSRFVSDYAPGSAFMLRTSDIDDFLFYEEFFMYWEEVELSFRLSKKGAIVPVKNSYVIREDNDVAREVNSIYYLVRNSFLIRKLTNRFTVYENIVYLLFMSIRSAKLGVKNRSVKPVRLFMKAISDALRNKYGYTSL